MTKTESGLCSSCYRKSRYLDDKTLEEATKNRKKDSNHYNQIRKKSRKGYLESNRPKKCAVCGYDTHIEICHIRDISDWPKDTLIREINDLDNLVALCRNHHWELDHGMLEL